MAAAEEGEKSQQVEQESDHRAEIFSGSEPTDQPLARRTVFWRRTGIFRGSRRPPVDGAQLHRQPKAVGTRPSLRTRFSSATAKTISFGAFVAAPKGATGRPAALVSVVVIYAVVQWIRAATGGRVAGPEPTTSAALQRLLHAQNR